MRFVAFLVLSFTLLAGCITTSNLSTNETLLAKGDDAIAVIGLNQHYRLGIKKGDWSDGSVHTSDLTFLSANVFPDNGYIVVKLKATSENERYAITQLLPTGILGDRFLPCDAGSQAPSFTLKPGTVTYLGDLNFEQTGDKMHVTYTTDSTAARNYIERHYLKLIDLYRESAIQFAPVTGVVCTTEVIVVVPMHN